MNHFERIDDLENGTFIIQDKRCFCFGTDAVLLANFAKVKKGGVVLDLCTGNGIIPILLSQKTQARHITGLEIQPESAELARRSVKLNSLENKISIVCGDLKNHADFFAPAGFDHITVNPPYIKNGGGLVNPQDSLAAARHEILCTLRDVICTASVLARVGGKITMIHRPDRLADIICLMREYKIEPKRICMVYPKYGAKANLILIEGTKGGNPHLVMEKPIIL